MSAIHLTSPTLADANLLVENLNLKHVGRFLSSNIPRPYTLDDAQWWISEGCKNNAINKIIHYNGQACGNVGVYLNVGGERFLAEIGYWLSPSYWNKGIATQAVNTFTDFIFKNTGVTTIVNPVSSTNIASRRVMEKSGYQSDQILKDSICHDGVYLDEYLYQIKRPL